MENIVVTIARQYGSGGKTIGEMYAEDVDNMAFLPEFVEPPSY